LNASRVVRSGRSAERPPRRLLRPPSSRSRRYAGLPVSACGLRLGHAPPVTLLQPLPLSGSRPARTALRASSWQPVVVPAGELDEGLPGRSEPSFLSGRGPPSPGALHFRRTRRGRRTPLRHGRHRLAPPRERGSGHYAGGRKRGDNFFSYHQALTCRSANLPLEGRSKSRSDFGRGAPCREAQPPPRKRRCVFDPPSRGGLGVCCTTRT